MPRHYDETIPHFFDHLENMFLGGGVYVTPPFDLDRHDYLRPIYTLFSIHSETLLCMNMYECLNVIDDDVYNVIYYVNVNFTNV